jgi:chemotaxis protein MotB
MMSDIPPIIVPPHLRPPSKIPLVVLALAALASLVIAVLQYRERQLSDGLVAVAKQEVKSARAQMAELGKRIEEIEAEMEGLQSAKAELAKSVETKEGELSELKGTFQGFQDKLKGEIARGEINLEQTGGKLRVGLVDKVLFDPGEAEVSKRGEEVLARVAEALAAIPDKQIQVSGHTDRMPINSKLVERYPTNWELSAARAVHVVRFLAEKAKVPPERLVASGYGEFHPLASNKTPGGRAKNRRIEILLTPMLAPRSVPKAKLKAAVETAAEKTGHKKAGKSGKREHKKKG